MQTSLFDPAPCPCGSVPWITEVEDGFAIFNWCLCERIWDVFGKTVSEVITVWGEKMGSASEASAGATRQKENT